MEMRKDLMAASGEESADEFAGVGEEMDSPLLKILKLSGVIFCRAGGEGEDGPESWAAFSLLMT